MSRKFLYRRSGSAVIFVIAILALFGLMAPPSAAAQDKPQLKRPQQSPEEKLPEEKKPKKKIKGPRAVGLLQLTASGKGTLIPIAILVDGKFYDASVYKADPIPMALESGTVYEAEQAGDSLGLFTISGALHSKNPGSPHPWVGAGSFLPQGADAPSSRRKAEDVPVGMDSSGSDEPPRLSRGKTTKPAAPSSQSPASGSSTPPAAGSSEKPGTAAPATPSQPAGGSSSGSSAGASTGPDAPKPATPPASDKPADQGAKQPTPAAAQTSPGQASPGQTSQGQTADNYYRPTLRRGKPTQSAPQEDEPAPTDKAPTDKTKTGKADSPGAAAASAEPVKLVPAISDAGGPDPRPYQFYWKTGEEEERRNQMLTLAADEVRAYANALARNQIPATPLPAAKKAPTARKAPAKPVQPVFENIQFRAFDVWANNQPVMILSAEAHLPPGAAAAPEQYSITLVARTDIYGNLRKLYSGVTDKFHLDVTPRLELIDVVDADGDGRGELLFRETTDAGGGYVIYRATADKLAKMFDSMSEQ
jgi:hypothetical protein